MPCSSRHADNEPNSRRGENCCRFGRETETSLHRVVVSTWHQCVGRSERGRFAATVEVIVRYEVVRRIPRWTAAVALVIAFCVTVIGTEYALIGSSGPSPHGAHALAAGPYGDFAVVEHPHADTDTTPVQPETIAHAVLPRMTTVLAALGLVVATAMASALRRRTAISVIRGPPRPAALVTVGQQLLTRLCIARR
jgi:hypothetical protein